MSTSTAVTPNIGITLPDLSATGWREDYLAFASKVDDGLGGTATGDPNGLVDANYIGQQVYDKTNNVWYTATEVAVATATATPWKRDGEFPSGTRQLFDQVSAPPGWSLATDTGDKLIRLATTATDGGGTGGTWTISGLTVDGHALTINEMPAHNHDIKGSNSSDGGAQLGMFRQNQNSTNATAVQSEGGGAAHTHGLTASDSWRPEYRNMLIAVKD